MKHNSTKDLRFGLVEETHRRYNSTGSTNIYYDMTGLLLVPGPRKKTWQRVGTWIVQYLSKEDSPDKFSAIFSLLEGVNKELIVLV